MIRMRREMAGYNFWRLSEKWDAAKEYDCLHRGRSVHGIEPRFTRDICRITTARGSFSMGIVSKNSIHDLSRLCQTSVCDTRSLRCCSDGQKQRRRCPFQSI